MRYPDVTLVVEDRLGDLDVDVYNRFSGSLEATVKSAPIIIVRELPGGSVGAFNSATFFVEVTVVANGYDAARSVAIDVQMRLTHERATVLSDGTWCEEVEVLELPVYDPGYFLGDKAHAFPAVYKMSARGVR